MAKINLTKTKRINVKRQNITIGDNVTISKENHKKLIKHIKERMQFGDKILDDQVERYGIIDREVAGYIILDPDDKKRERDNVAGRGPKVTDTVIPLTMVQLQEALTYVMSVIAPDSGMYAAIALAEKQDIAKGFANLMNQNAQKFKHYKNIAKGVFDMLKYNFGGYVVEWERVFGNVIEAGTSGGVNIKSNQLVHSGNAVQAIDPYNFRYDISVPYVELPMKGEYFAIVGVTTPFRLRKMEADGQLFNTDIVIKETVSFEESFYNSKPVIHVDHSGKTKTDIDWVKILSAGIGPETQKGIEISHFYGWIIPTDFGLSSSKEYEIWRFTVGNGKHIMSSTHLNNAHGMLPCALGAPWDDGFELQTKSFAELLNPLQRFASFQLNTHQRASRKKLYGVTIYNKNLINLDRFDPVAGVFPANPPAMTDFDLRKAFVQFTDAPNTDNTLRDIAATDDLMQKILPTDILRQVSSLERATQYQAAAVVQGANRRNHLITKILDDQCFSVVRDIQLFNVYQFQDVLDVIDENGDLAQVNPSEFIEARIEFDIADGLKGIDKLSIIEGIKDIINMLLQSKQANERIDIVAIIDYFTSLLGDKTDFKQFQFKSEFDKLGIQEKQLAMQLLQQFFQEQEQGEGQGTGTVARLPVTGGGNV